MRVINFYGGPGSGKSTTRADLFSLMKKAGFRVEEAPEFAKDLTYNEQWRQLRNQSFVTAGQEERLSRLVGQVDWCISDSPLPVAFFYCRGTRFDADWYKTYVWNLFDGYDNINIFLKRVKQYQTYGRSQTEGEARDIDAELREVMGERIDLEVDGDDHAASRVFAYLQTLEARG